MIHKKTRYNTSTELLFSVSFTRIICKDYNIIKIYATLCIPKFITLLAHTLQNTTRYNKSKTMIPCYFTIILSHT